MPAKIKPIIGLTLGDPAGIGPEIIAKSLANSGLRNSADFVIIGHKDIFSRYSKKQFKNITIVEPPDAGCTGITPGRASRQGALAARAYLKKAVELLKGKHISRLVTAPVCKETLSRLGMRFYGHTEFLARAFKVRDFDMMFVAPKMKTVIVTRHLALKDISRTLTRRGIYDSIVLTHNTLKTMFKIRRPRLAVCGLNPHAGEGGDIGSEELLKIIPAIRLAKRQGITVDGPLPGDTIFTVHNACKYDIIIAMYHDQGLIPVKTLYFKELVNLTIGLPFIRTSPCHGTAFDIAGKNKADPSSMQYAIRLACRLAA